MAKQMTKQQLVDECIRLRAECDRLECELASTKAVAGNPRIPQTYVEYVRAAREAQRSEGHRVIGYMTREQFENSRA